MPLSQVDYYDISRLKKLSWLPILVTGQIKSHLRHLAFYVMVSVQKLSNVQDFNH